MGRFQFVESPIFGDGFELSHPEIRTYLGQGIDDPYATVRFDYTPHGFHAMILSPFGTVFIDPYSQNETDYYMSYYKHDYRRTTQNDFQCLTESHDNIPLNYYVNRTGEQLRTYRLAVSCTGEFTGITGGVGGALSNIATTVNRITGVYECRTRQLLMRL
jgi:hypothetical protein